MRFAWRRSRFVVMAASVACALGSVAVHGQAAPEQKPQMAEEVFKNIQVLKGIPVDEFMDTMGMFAAATTKDCTGCHAPEILSGARDAFAKPTPMIQMARMMTVMMNNIDRQYFGGRKRVTCYTCHTGTPAPGRVPNLAIQYGTPPPENPNAMDFIALPDRANEVDAIFAKYIQAIGGAQRLSGVTSLVASGTYAGWDTAQSEVPVEIFAQSAGPDDDDRSPERGHQYLDLRRAQCLVRGRRFSRVQLHDDDDRRQPDRRAHRRDRGGRPDANPAGLQPMAGERGARGRRSAGRHPPGHEPGPDARQPLLRRRRPARAPGAVDRHGRRVRCLSSSISPTIARSPGSAVRFAG